MERPLIISVVVVMLVDSTVQNVSNVPKIHFEVKLIGGPRTSALPSKVQISPW